jgi:hypothetical protein
MRLPPILNLFYRVAASKPQALGMAANAVLRQNTYYNRLIMPAVQSENNKRLAKSRGIRYFIACVLLLKVKCEL